MPEAWCSGGAWVDARGPLGPLPGAYGPGPYGPPCALMGRALIGLPGPLWAGRHGPGPSTNEKVPYVCVYVWGHAESQEEPSLRLEAAKQEAAALGPGPGSIYVLRST